MTEAMVFDGHNDVLLRLWKHGSDGAADLFQNPDAGHINAPKAKAGGLFGGMFAVFVPSGGEFSMPDFIPPYDIPLPPSVGQQDAMVATLGMMSIAHKLAEAQLLRVCSGVDDIVSARSEGRLAALLHLEGAEPIDPDFAALDTLYDLGLRSIGPVWSRPNVFGHGVPFRFPATPDIGPGLSHLGKELVRRATGKGMMIDTSHMNLAGFWDVAEEAVPLVATHSNAHEISPGARNLTDEQLRAIGETGGMAGLNFATMFLRPDGRNAGQGCMDAALEHLDHMIRMAGEDCVGLGSDFDGAPMPGEIADAGALGNLIGAMERYGFGDQLVRKICGENWLGLIRRVIG